ncbi:MAG: glycosyltransferase family 2 protein [Candidatus Cloacimonetes bacterium]|nr:glycosyltransferase family 2 protein [Candidatus Cloacimonadota bacterium]
MNKDTKKNILDSQKRISILIPTHNDSKYLGDCLDSIVSQSYKNYEIIICDDHSKKDEFDKIKSIVSKYNEKCESITLHRNETNLGYQRNWNKCIELANNDIFHILHADDVFHNSEVIFKLVNFLNDNKDFALVGGLVDIINAEGKLINSSNGDGEEVWYKGQVYEFVTQKNSYINSSTVMMRKSFIQQVGLFDPEIEGADEELWPRVLTKFPIAVLGESLVSYRIHPEQIESKFWFNKRNFTDTWKKFKVVMEYEERVPLRKKMKKHLKKKFSRSSLYVADRVLKEFQSKKMSLWHLLVALRFEPLIIFKSKGYWLTFLRNFKSKKSLANNKN